MTSCNMHYIQKNNVLSLEFYHHPTENPQTQSPTSKLILAKPGNDFLMQNKHRCSTLRQLARTRWDMGDAQLCKWRCLLSHVLFCGCCRYCLQRRIRGLRDVAASTSAYCLTWRPVPVLGTMSPHGRREEWTLNTILWPLLLQMDAHMHRNMLAKRNINWQKKTWFFHLKTCELTMGLQTHWAHTCGCMQKWHLRRTSARLFWGCQEEPYLICI